MTSRGTILVVDDNRLVLATLTDGLTRAGYHVIDADNGDDAILLAREHRPDLALLDIRMEGKSGFDVAQYLRSQQRMPFMFLSAFSDEDTVAQVKALGAVAYLVKPLDIRQIVPAVEAAFADIDAARAHAGDLPIEYRVGAVEDLNEAFPVVTALEVIEHVADPAAFLRLLARLIEPGGLLFVSTLNRTLRSLAVAKLGAEYVLRLLPVGTHKWRQFITPAELGAYGKAAGFRVADISGVLFDVQSWQWQAGADLAVNYIAMLERRAGS